MNNPTPAMPPSIVVDGNDVYYNEINDDVKADVLKHVVVFTDAQIREAWSKSLLRHLQLVSTNKFYRALPTGVWTAILELHMTLHAYRAEFYDCDAFSAAFSGLTSFTFEVNGIARVLDISGHHSYNAVLVSDDGETCHWRRVEPQSDEFLSNAPRKINVTAPDGAYAAKRGFAITV